MVDGRFPFEGQVEYERRVVLDKLDEGIELTEDEQQLLDSMNLAKNVLSDENTELIDAMRKWEDGEELTEKEEQLVLDILNNGDNMLGATT